MSAVAVDTAGRLDHALKLAGQGIPVFPCRANKAPLVALGFKAATVDEKRIRQWWGRNPDALIGVPTGSVSGLLAIDIDPYGIDFAFEHGEILEKGRRHKTRRGFHYLFRMPADARVGCSAGRVAEGVDVRGDGGYIIWWPACGLKAVGPEIASLPLPNDELLALIVPPRPPVVLTSNATPEASNLFRLKHALSSIDPDNGYEPWIKIGMALHFEGDGSEEAFDIWNSWSFYGISYKGVDDLRSHWRSFSSAPGKNLVTAQTILRACSPDDFPDDESDARRVVKLFSGRLHEHASQCETMLADDIYVRERSLVRIGGVDELSSEDAAGIQRDLAQAVIIPASAEYLRRRLNQLVRFETYRRREKLWFSVDAPKDLVINIAGQGDWSSFRRLATIAKAPFVRADGTICEEPGYDATSRVFHQPNEEFPPVPENPSQDDAVRALETLLGPFREFPFANEAAISAFAAAILTEAVRPAIDASPAFFYTAPSAGTGKSLLSEMPSRIVHGCAPAMRPWAENQEELRKALFSSLLAGDRTLGFDNLPQGVKVWSPNLCLFLTADVYSDRRLGSSDVPAIPNRSVVFLTGNNITPAGDLARRSLVVRLDANTTRLRDRVFRIPNLRGHVAERRAELLIAALTIIKAFTMSEAASQNISLPSFERWSHLVRDPLVWLGLTDPVATQDEEAENDEQPLAEVFALIAAQPSIGDKEFTAADLAALCDSLDGDTSLGAALESAGCSGAADQRQVGYWLRQKRDHIAGGFKLMRGGEAHGAGRKWRLRKST